MKKIITIILIFLISTLTLIGCVPPKDDNNPPQEPNNPIYTERVFEVDGEYTTFVHLQILYPNGPREVNIPKIFWRTQDLLHYQEIESIEHYLVTGNDDVAVGLISRTIVAMNDHNPKIDNLVILSTRNNSDTQYNDLQIRVTKGDYENWTVRSVQFTRMAT